MVRVVALTVMLLQAMATVKEPVTWRAVVVFVFVVFHQIFVVCKVVATATTIVVFGTLNVVLFKSIPRPKISFTIIAVVMV